LAFWGEALASPELASEQRARARALADRFRHCLELLASDGNVARGDLREPANRLAALIHGIAAEAVFDPRKWTIAAQRAAISAELAAAGVILPPGEQAPTSPRKVRTR